jgi:hypothetical protein
MPGFLLLVFIGILVWLPQRRQSSSDGASMKCPACSGGIQNTYFRCPHCGEGLKHHCPNCSKVMQQDWACCPYCREDQTPFRTQPQNSRA